MYELHQQLKTVQIIVEVPATDEIHIEDRKYGLSWTKSNNGYTNTLNSQLISAQTDTF